MINQPHTQVVHRTVNTENKNENKNKTVCQSVYLAAE